MKKYLALAVAVLFTLGFAASAFAIHAEIPSETQAVVAKGATQITIGGDLRMRGTLFHNANIGDLSNDSKNQGGDRAIYEARIRLLVDAQVSPSTMGRIHMEAGSANNNDNMTFGTASPSGAAGNLGAGETKLNDMRILEAWIQHKGTGLIGVPAYVKVGHMPIRISNGLFYDHVRFGDEALLFGIEPIKGLEITVGNIKLAENQTASADDLDAYTAIVAYQINKGSKVGLDVTYVDGQNTTMSLGGLNAAAGTFSFPSRGNLHLWNFGINGMTKIAGFGLKGELNIQRGSGSVENSTLDDLKFRGYAFTVDADYTLNPVTLKAGIGYGSGTKTNDLPVTGGKVKTFMTTQSIIPHYTFVYDYFVANAAGNVAGGLQNTMYIRLGGAMNITKDLYADLTAYYLRAAKTGDFVDATGSHSISKNIGVEIDGNIKYKIDRNLTYYVEGGYLFAGNFFKLTNSTRDIDDAWCVRHGVQLSF